jgi:hypothetical protein
LISLKPLCLAIVLSHSPGLEGQLYYLIEMGMDTLLG